MADLIAAVLTRLLLPLAAVWLLLTAGLALALAGRRRAGLAALALGVAALYALSIPVLSNALRTRLEGVYAPHAPAEAPAADAIVVLGGGLSTAEPPRPWPDLNRAADRVLHGARLYRAGRAPWIVTTGGAAEGSAGTQAEAMAAWLVELGVPAEAIRVAIGSSDTRGDALETRALLGPDSGRLLLVTSALHMPRALATFRGAGLHAVPSPTDFEAIHAGGEGVLAWIPDAEALDGTSRAVKEILGCLVYGLRGWTAGPLACWLGEAGAAGEDRP